MLFYSSPNPSQSHLEISEISISRIHFIHKGESQKSTFYIHRTHTQGNPVPPPSLRKLCTTVKMLKKLNDSIPTSDLFFLRPDELLDLIGKEVGDDGINLGKQLGLTDEQLQEIQERR